MGLPGALDLRPDGDLIVVTWNGDLDVEATRQLLQCIESVQRTHERVFVLVDAHAGSKIEPQARKLAIEWKLPHDLAAVAIVGASAPSVILLNVLAKALRLVRGIVTPVHFVKSEKAGRAWIDAARRGYQGT